MIIGLCLSYDCIFQTSNVENLAPHVIRAVRKEMMELTKSPPEGLKVHLNDADVTDIQATLDGPQGTPFAGGVSTLTFCENIKIN